MPTVSISVSAADRRGEEFRDDLRPLGAARSGPETEAETAPAVAQRAGSGNAAARRLLGADELAPLTRLDDLRSALAVAQTFSSIGLALAFAAALGFGPWWLLSMLVIGVQQHALFILAHEAAHYRLFSQRRLNDTVGRFIGMIGAISMCTYRVIHRLHHNHLYTEDDPDTAIHGGYPRGVAYLWKKLAQDLAGLNAWKTLAYFFGAPAINDDTRRAARPLDDTSAALRAAARTDRWAVLAFQLGAPLLAFVFAGWRGAAVYGLLWVVPLLTVLQPILRLRAICEHGAVTDLSSPLTAARSNCTGRALSGRGADTVLNLIGRALLFPHHVNYHLEHHLYPAVPHYHLPRLHRLLQSRGALHGAEVCDLADTLRRVFAPRLRPARVAAA